MPMRDGAAARAHRHKHYQRERNMHELPRLFRSVCVFICAALLLPAVSLAKGFAASDTCYGVAPAKTVIFPTGESYCGYLFNAFKAKGKHYKSYKYVDDGLRCDFFTAWGTDSCRVSKVDGEPNYKDPAECEAQKGKRYKEGNFGYEVKGKGSGDKVLTGVVASGNGKVATCVDGCTVSGGLADVLCLYSGTDQEKCWVQAVGARFTGKTCTTSNDSLGLPDTKTPDPEHPNDPKFEIPGWITAPKPTENGAMKCPAGKCPGQINGVDVCVKCDKTGSINKKTSESDNTKTDPKTGSSDKKNKSEESTTLTRCANGVCETTTQTTKKNADGTTEQSKTTERTGQADYCARNPHDKANCGAASPGDKESKGDACKDNPNRLGCLELGGIDGSGEKMNKKEASVDFEVNSINMPNACPADKQIQILGKTHVIELRMLCDAADTARPFVLVMASVFALLIVVQGLRK